MPVHLDVVIKADTHAFPLGPLVAFLSKQLQGWPIQGSKQRSPCPLPFAKGALVEPVAQDGNCVVDFGK